MQQEKIGYDRRISGVGEYLVIELDLVVSGFGFQDSRFGFRVSDFGFRVGIGGHVVSKLDLVAPDDDEDADHGGQRAEDHPRADQEELQHTLQQESLYHTYTGFMVYMYMGFMIYTYMGFMVFMRIQVRKNFSFRSSRKPRIRVQGLWYISI